MYIAIDVILTVIIAAVVISAVKRGFIYSVFKLGTTIAAIVIASIFYKELSLYFSDAFVLQKASDSIGSILGELSADITAATDISAIAGAIPEQLKIAAELVGINIEDVLGSLSIADTSTVVDAIGDSLATSIASTLSNILAFAALFFGSLILLGLIGKLLDKIAKLPVLNGANRFLGFLLGAVEGLVLGVVLSKVAAALLSTYGAINPDFTFTDVANNTYVAKFFIDICPW